MLKKLSVVLIVFACFTSNIFGAEAPFKMIGEYQNWMEHYYEKPTPAQVVPAIRNFCEAQMLDKVVAISATTFFGTLFKKDDALAESAYNQITQSKSDDEKILLVNALWYANTPACRALLQKTQKDWLAGLPYVIAGQKIAAPEPESLLSMPIENTFVIDMLWASFYATGEAAPVERIISALPLKNNDKKELKGVGLRANTSIMVNAQNHPKVMEICKQAILTSDAAMAKLVNDAITLPKLPAQIQNTTQVKTQDATQDKTQNTSQDKTQNQVQTKTPQIDSE